LGQTLTKVTLISKVTNAVIEQVVEWQARPLDEIYPIVCLDCIVVKVLQDKAEINKAIYLAVTEASKKWTMPMCNWRSALNRFPIEFEDRLTDYL